ncbi:MAG: 4-hydroxythreonine-4-phosphate dehydrogenase PdxA [Planctomycetes bacterium]|nr:4-hydroxythreonine-4-phosphate dehydrogenase PdxA [Planctomycetota bacterium]
MERPLLLVTLGDPNGIGPEVLLKALSPTDESPPYRVVVVGGSGSLEDARDRLSIPVGLVPVDDPRRAQGKPGRIEVFEEGCPPSPPPRPGVVDGVCGAASAAWLERAARLALEGKGDALVTGPVHKEALRAGGVREHDQTGILARVCGTRRVAMVACVERLRVLLATRHASLRSAIGDFTVEKVGEALDLAADGLRLFGVPSGKIALAALNPHASEGGMFGSEESEILRPAVERARARGLAVTGPHSADSVFARAAEGDFDLVVALLHDQGLIAVKTLGFRRAATVLVGLPILRVGVIHGAAFDIAGKGIADGSGMRAALDLAATLAGARARPGGEPSSGPRRSAPG